MNKVTQIKDMITNMTQEELMKLKEDLEKGSVTQLVNTKLQEKQESYSIQICPVCHSDITEESMTLIFGPKGLRKKASFCASDCLEYFLRTKIKQEEQNEHRA